MLEGREIIVGVSGGIAAYKAAALTSLLVQQGAGRMAEPEEIAGVIRDLLTGVPGKRSS